MIDDERRKFLRRLKREIDDYGLSRLSRKSGIARSTLGQIDGKRGPTVDTLLRISRALNKPIVIG